ncbi:MAG TPA: response regulator transcription factor [Mycobacteriales bacterium]|nr:response regulator transcription factor [Mycobacteriales bacterium]
MTTVLICDDHRQVREGLRRTVETVPGVDRVDTAASGEEVLSRWPMERQDLVLMDLQMPGLGGLEATRRLLRAHPDANVVMLTGSADRDLVALAISGGARGFLHKDVSREEVCAAVASAVAANELATATGPRPAPAAPGMPELTEREMQVLRGMAAGRSNAEIGRELYLSEDTIKTHARRLFRKMQVNDRAQAVAAGFRHGLVR